jgi:tRNA A-37 threonylcarbamoyl transferase component Bud32
VTPLAQDLFAQARELPAANRDAFLAQACGDNAALHLEVQRLLVDAERADSFFGDENGATLGAEEFKDGYSEKEGDEVGPYKLRQQIGEGGFGTVWMAEQSVPISRMVALKVIKAGKDTKQVLARFEAERQALAMMDHPNIAKVLDAGATATGRPYFAMELVKGIPITDYCDQAGLGTKERLALFRDVCSAINHAHQKGVIHPDTLGAMHQLAHFRGSHASATRRTQRTDGSRTKRLRSFGRNTTRGRSRTLRTPDFRVVLAMQVVEVAEIDGVKDADLRFPSGDEMQVVVNTAATDTLLSGTALRGDDLIHAEFHEGHARHDALANHPRRDIGIHPHAEPASGERREGLIQRVRCRPVPRLVQQRITCGMVRVVRHERSHQYRAVQIAAHLRRARSASASRSSRTALPASVTIPVRASTSRPLDERSVSATTGISLTISMRSAVTSTRKRAPGSTPKTRFTASGRLICPASSTVSVAFMC